MNLTLPTELGDRLASEAKKRGATVECFAAELLERALPMSDKARSAINLLREWGQQDEHLTDAEVAQHRAVLHAIDEDRPSDRKLFESVLSEPSR
jgi:hypothetical protein